MTNETAKVKLPVTVRRDRGGPYKWQLLDAEGAIIAYIRCTVDDGQEIVTALNSHTALIEAARAAATELDKMKLSPSAQAAYLQLRTALEKVWK